MEPPADRLIEKIDRDTGSSIMKKLLVAALFQKLPQLEKMHELKTNDPKQSNLTFFSKCKL